MSRAPSLAARPAAASWGPDDEAGALNEITAAVTLAAVQLVRRGEVHDLAHVLHADIPAFAGPHVSPVPDDELPPDQSARRGLRTVGL